MYRRTASLAISVVLFAALGIEAAPVFGQDVDGSSDHPLVSRFEGSTITRFDRAAFDEYRLVTAPVAGYLNGRNVDDEDLLTDQNSVHLEGEVVRITYEAPDDASTLQVQRSYERALERAGFEVLLKCSNAECEGASRGAGLSGAIHHRTGFWFSGNITEDQRFLSARLSRPGGDVFVSMLVLGLRESHIQLDVVEVEGIVDGLVKVDAGAIRRSLETDGSFTFTGVLFESGSDELRAESVTSLQSIAEVLQSVPRLHLRVVGHTDDTGDIQSNMELSRRRAEAVVFALQEQFAVEPSRLEAYGVGPLAPTGSNATEESRALNRRVVIIKASE